MDFKSVVSSNIEGVHYDVLTQAMTVKFKNGGSYEYSGVPEDEYDGLVNAASCGQYLNDSIKGVYPHKRV